MPLFCDKPCDTDLEAVEAIRSACHGLLPNWQNPERYFIQRSNITSNRRPPAPTNSGCYDPSMPSLFTPPDQQAKKAAARAARLGEVEVKLFALDGHGPGPEVCRQIAQVLAPVQDGRDAQSLIQKWLAIQYRDVVAAVWRERRKLRGL
jgi:hypothetical protein